MRAQTDSGKRCFIYCGDERCTCDARPNPFEFGVRPMTKPPTPTMDRWTDSEPLGLCQSCFRTGTTEVGSIRADDRSWVESTVRLCENPDCRAIRAGTLEDRLAWIEGVYGYKYFGDYELSEDQKTAVWESFSIAKTLSARSGGGDVVELREALERAALRFEKLAEACAGVWADEQPGLKATGETSARFAAEARAVLSRIEDRREMARGIAPTTEPNFALLEVCHRMEPSDV